jgi:hypothetical protein
MGRVRTVGDGDGDGEQCEEDSEESRGDEMDDETRGGEGTGEEEDGMDKEKGKTENETGEKGKVQKGERKQIVTLVRDQTIKTMSMILLGAMEPVVSRHTGRKANIWNR